MVRSLNVFQSFNTPTVYTFKSTRFSPLKNYADFKLEILMVTVTSPKRTSACIHELKDTQTKHSSVYAKTVLHGREEKH